MTRTLPQAYIVDAVPVPRSMPTCATAPSTTASATTSCATPAPRPHRAFDEFLLVEV